jgi:type I restriction enzyme S subunit
MYFEYIHSEIIDDRIDAQFFTPEYIKSLKKINQFRIETLGNISRRIFDPPHTAPEFVDKSDFEMIMIENITLNGIEGNFRAISETCHKDIFKNSHLEGNELLVSRVGNSSGTFASVFPCYKGKNVSGNISIIKLKDEIIDKEYAFAYFNSNIGQNSIKRNIANTARKFLTISKIREFQVPIPSPEIQKYIGDKVRKAEELREEAKKLKKEAEGIIYKELNFGSLEDKLKIINNKYTWVGLHNLGIRIDSKYYNEKVLRIKDYFNKHYETIKLKECLQYCSRGKSFAESSEDGIILIKTKNLNNSFINYERNFVYEKEVNNNLILKEKDLIFASMGVGSLGKIDMYYPSEEKATIDGTLMLLRFKSDSKLKPEYVMEFLRTHIGQKLIYQNVVGSTGIISISVDDLINIDIPYIDDEKQEKISNFTNKYLTDIYASKRLIQEAKQDVEDLIEGNFDMSKVRANS